MAIEGKSFKFKTKGKTCFLRVTKIKGNNKIFCDLVSIEKQKSDGSLLIDIHSGLDRRLYLYNSNIYSTSTNAVLDEITDESFTRLYESSRGIKDLTKVLTK